MAKRRMGILLASLLCLSLLLMPLAVSAASPISLEKECSLTIRYRHDGTAFSGETIQLYRVADVSEGLEYTLTDAFADTGLNLNGIQSNREWDVIRSTLEAYLLSHYVQPVQTAVTDEAGEARFSQLKPGLYLASSVTVVKEDLTCYFASALVALPGLDPEGSWQEEVTASAKSEVLPPIRPDEKLDLKVVKLWKGDNAGRPNSIDVEIYRDGALYETVTLSNQNNWSYQWTVIADGAMWNVVEKNVPEGYVMTVEQRDTSFVITNTSQIKPPPDPPKTGDTPNVMIYTLVMYGAGVMLLILGLLGKRKRHEEN